MTEEKAMVSEGTVIEDMPNDMYRIELDSGYKVVAHIGGVMRMKFTRLRPGERVRIELSSYDHSRGRIVERLK